MQNEYTVYILVQLQRTQDTYFFIAADLVAQLLQLCLAVQQLVVRGGRANLLRFRVLDLVLDPGALFINNYNIINFTFITINI